MPNRCEQCKKKLGICEYKCKCEKLFCITHLHAESHNCTYDYKAEGQAQLKKQNDVGPLSSKLERI
jgi:hypothetical protein